MFYNVIKTVIDDSNAATLIKLLMCVEERYIYQHERACGNSRRAPCVDECVWMCCRPHNWHAAACCNLTVSLDNFLCQL